jgi:hypothetical protein
VGESVGTEGMRFATMKRYSRVDASTARKDARGLGGSAAALS